VQIAVAESPVTLHSKTKLAKITQWLPRLQTTEVTSGIFLSPRLVTCWHHQRAQKICIITQLPSDVLVVDNNIL